MEVMRHNSVNYYLMENGVLSDIAHWKNLLYPHINLDVEDLDVIVANCVANIGKIIACYRLDERYSLLINSFRNAIMVVQEDTLGRLRCNIDALSEEEKLFFAYNLSTDLGYLEALKKGQAKSNVKSYGICLSYACNMKCVYCFQQHVKDLSKVEMTDERLDEILSHIASDASKSNASWKVIQLFGGEPLLPGNLLMVERILKFCKAHDFDLSIVSNGYYVDHYMDLFAQYRTNINSLNITLDGSKRCHNSRRLLKCGNNSYDTIIGNINGLIGREIGVEININLDPQNIGDFAKFLKIAEVNNWYDNNRVQLTATMVDNRLYSTRYSSYFSEAELLEKLIKFCTDNKFPNNFVFTFLKTTLPIYQKLCLPFTPPNTHYRGHFCWATSDMNNVFYMDGNHDMYRCLYVVGMEEYSLGKLENIEGVKHKVQQYNNHSVFGIDKCKKCQLGGYCGGGCIISHMKDEKRVCSEEKENFEYFVHNILISIIKSKLYQLIN